MAYACLLMLTIWPGFDKLNVLRSGKPMYEHFRSYRFDMSNPDNLEFMTMFFFSPSKNTSQVLDLDF